MSFTYDSYLLHIFLNEVCRGSRNLFFKIILIQIYLIRYYWESNPGLLDATQLL